MKFSVLSRFFAYSLAFVSSAALAADPTPAPAPDAVRIACIGDTITDMSNYPKVLAQYLAADYDLAKYHGKAYDVRNFGVPDTTVVMTEKPWIKTPKADDAKAFLPQIVIIEIGTQDTQKGKNWNAIATFPDEYKNLVNAFASLPSKPKIYVCLPPPIYGTDGWGMSEENLVSTVIPNIKRVAEELKLPVIDLHTALSDRPDTFDHSVHPTGDAKKYIATAIYTAVFGIDPPWSLAAPPTIFPMKNILTVGGAEMDPAAKEAALWINKGGTLNFVTDPVRNGKHAAKLSGRASDTDSLGIDITAVLNESGPGDYAFRGFARLGADPGDKNRAQCWITLTYVDDKSVHIITGTKLKVGAGAWTPAGGCAALKWTGTLKSATLLVSSNAKEDLLLDDVELGKFTYTPPAK